MTERRPPRARSPRSVWSPSPLGAARREDTHLAAEADAIVAVLRDRGPLDVRELRRLTDARLWGPGRFGPALAHARREGRVVRAGLRRWAAAPD